MFFYDSISGIWAFIYIVITGKVRNLLKVMKTKSVRTAIIIGFLAGPIAMTGYYGAVNYMGASNVATFIAIYPVVGALFSALILKERLNYKAWIGLVLSIIGVMVLGYAGD
ncbi:MAG: EamA family transporter [Sarcina sp.]